METQEKLYSEQELRAKLSKYANEVIDTISHDGTGFAIYFKKGFSTVRLGYGQFGLDASFATLTQVKEACKRSNIIEISEDEAKLTEKIAAELYRLHCKKKRKEIAHFEYDAGLQAINTYFIRCLQELEAKKSLSKRGKNHLEQSIEWGKFRRSEPNNYSDLMKKLYF